MIARGQRHLQGVTTYVPTCSRALLACSSRKGTVEAAQHLAKDAEQHCRAPMLRSAFVRDAAHLERLRMSAAQTKNKQLQVCFGASAHKGVVHTTISLCGAGMMGDAGVCMHA